MNHNQLLKTVSKKPNKLLNTIALITSGVIFTGLGYWALVILSDTL